MQINGFKNMRACHCKICGKYLLKGEGIGVNDGLSKSFTRYLCQPCSDKETEINKAWQSAKEDLDEINNILRDNSLYYLDIDIRINNLMLCSRADMPNVAERIKHNLTNSLVVNYELIDQIICDEYTNLRSERDD